MTLKDKAGRECECEVDGSMDDYYLVSGIYHDDDSEVPDHVLEELQRDNDAEIYELVLNNAIGRAEAAYEGDR